MSWKCIKCETSNSDSREKCEVCNFERLYTKSDFAAELAKARVSFQPPIRHNRKPNNHWISCSIFLLGLTLLAAIICVHYKALSDELSLRVEKSREIYNTRSEQLRKTTKWLESICFVGPTDHSGDGGYINIYEGLYFDVFENCKLYSVDIYPRGQGTITVELLDNGRNVIEDKEVFVFDGRRNKVHLGFTLKIGKNYLLKARGNEAVSLYRNVNRAKEFPYELRNIIKITNSTLGRGYYYFFYNWQISILC